MSELEIVKLPADFSFADFVCQFLIPCEPCLFYASVSKGWRCVQDWRVSDSDRSANVDLLIDKFGDDVVPVVDCSGVAEYGTYECLEMKLQDYFEVAKARPDGTKFALYCKDWHLQQQHPAYHAYQTPSYFQWDYLNEFWDAKKDRIEADYRFVYIGSDATWTPFHADVFRSHSWSANICGRKRWYLVPPASRKKLPKELTDLRKCSEELRREIGVIEVVQLPGEIIFVPSHWWHQVHNLDTWTVSVNHNWVNASNIWQMWHYILDCLANVEREIDDVRGLMTPAEFTAQCQAILKADIGICIAEFAQMIDILLAARGTAAASRKDAVMFCCSSCGLRYAECKLSTADCRARLLDHLKAKCACTDSLRLCDSCHDFVRRYDVEILTDLQTHVNKCL